MLMIRITDSKKFFQIFIVLMLMQETMDMGMNRAIGGIDFEIFGKFNKDFSD